MKYKKVNVKTETLGQINCWTIFMFTNHPNMARGRRQQFKRQILTYRLVERHTEKETHLQRRRKVDRHKTQVENERDKDIHV